MKKHIVALLALLVLCLSLARTSPVRAQPAPPAVHAVLFYSPSCPHCHLVINETLPPLVDRYGEQFQVIGIDVTRPDGDALFGAALQKFGLEVSGVPFMVVGDYYLVGSAQIPEQLPGIIEAGLAQGGIDWPDIPGLRAALDSAGAEAGAATESPAAPEATVPEPAEVDWRDRYAFDPVGNTFSVIVLIGMLASAAWGVSRFQRPGAARRKPRATWWIPALSILGAAVAGYLAYVEAFELTAVCGPVGDCNTVQQSEYARLFGIVPIGVMGLGGYAAILAAWLAARYSTQRTADLGAAALLVMTAFGTLFSIYLTFLEPFVIGATCAWCLTSSVMMTVLMLLCVAPGSRAITALRATPRRRR